MGRNGKLSILSYSGVPIDKYSSTIRSSKLPFQIQLRGTSLVVLFLRLCLSMQGEWVPSLIRELRSHMP